MMLLSYLSASHASVAGDNTCNGAAETPTPAKNIARDVSNVGHWGNGAYEIRLADLEDVDYVLSLLKQSLRRNKE